jgi:predicted dehydrogenase
MDHFSRCVRENRTPLTPGEEGLADLRVIEAIYKAAKTGKTISLRS